MLASGTRFGHVLAGAEYGKAAEFRHGLAERELAYEDCRNFRVRACSLRPA